jgi:hypothetical protein
MIVAKHLAHVIYPVAMAAAVGLSLSLWPRCNFDGTASFDSRPLIADAAGSEHSQSTAAAISSGLPILPIGSWAITFATPLPVR